MTDLKAAAEAAKAATSDNWFHGEYSDIEYAPPKGDENGAHWFPVADELAPAVCDYLIAAQPSAVLALYAERDEARKSATRAENALKLHAGDCMSLETEINDLRRHHDADMKAAEAALSAERAEVERLRAALERIRNLDEADGHDLTWQHASEAVGLAHQALTKETPHAD